MSSPLAKLQKSTVDQVLINAHQQLSHRHRIGVLAHELAIRISELGTATLDQPVRVLDVGCGDMTLADAITLKLQHANFSCVDVHPCSSEQVERDPRWRRYSTFDGRNLDFAENSFDVVLLSDVLHHVDPTIQPALLRSAGRVGKHVLIKDHLERGWFSRQMLRAMDFVGNFGYGVPIPSRYFDRKVLDDLLMQAGLTLNRIDVGIDLYAHLPLVGKILSPDWQVIAVASRSSSETSGT